MEAVPADAACSCSEGAGLAAVSAEDRTLAAVSKKMRRTNLQKTQQSFPFKEIR